LVHKSCHVINTIRERVSNHCDYEDVRAIKST
jgi:hypothetical protein